MEAIVEFDGVTKTFGDALAPTLTELTVDIRRGEIFGVIGESGAGKSTLLQLVNGLLTPTAGSVRVDGREVPALGRRALRELRRDIGVLFQGIHLLSNLTVHDNIALPLRLARRGRRLSPAQQRERVAEMIDFVGLGHRQGHYPAQLSGGEQQRVGLARALVTGPQLLLCDEPTSSLDARTTADVLGVLRRAQSELGTTIIVITHDLDVVRALCERAALLEDGRLVELFDIARADHRALPTYREQVRRELGS